MTNTLPTEYPICPSYKQDNIECLENCTVHKYSQLTISGQCAHCGYSECDVNEANEEDSLM